LGFADPNLDFEPWDTNLGIWVSWDLLLISQAALWVLGFVVLGFAFLLHIPRLNSKFGFWLLGLGFDALGFDQSQP